LQFKTDILKSPILFIIFIFLFSANALAQENVQEDVVETKKTIDSVKVPWAKKYREDQFYIALSHNVFLNRPTGSDQNMLSIGLSTGFLRDIALSKNRHFALAPGLGLGYLRINSFILPAMNGLSNGFSKTNINQFLVEAPIEFRWRNSTLASHVFFRVHVGTKLTYNFFSETTLTNNSTSADLSFNNQDNLSRLTWQNYLAIGYNTWNVYVAYTHTPFYKNETLGNELLRANLLSFGFIFYIL
jgi:hypothetical protein